MSRRRFGSGGFYASENLIENLDKAIAATDAMQMGPPPVTTEGDDGFRGLYLQLLPQAKAG